MSGNLDLKIELTNLFGIHSAATRIRHGYRAESGKWEPYPASQFAYAFFAFNGIFSFDWVSSFAEVKARRWRSGRETDQIRKYVRFLDGKLAHRFGGVLGDRLAKSLIAFDIRDAPQLLAEVHLPNSDGPRRRAAVRMTTITREILSGNVARRDVPECVVTALNFIYHVRCSLFHCSKKHVALLDLAQQRRFLVYCSWLTCANAMLFEIAKEPPIDWVEPPNVWP